jgi:hypothetical protein
MPTFHVEFQLTGKIEVAADDADDAREFVHCLAPQQLLRWAFCEQQVTLAKEIQVINVVPTSNPLGPTPRNP